MADVRQEVVEVGGMRTRVLTSGFHDTDEAVVLLHGAPGDATVWRHLQPRIGDFARAVAFDLPGYGTNRPPGNFPYTVDAYAHFIGLVLTHLGIRRAHLVMNDVGGTALQWAADNPSLLGSSIQMGTGLINHLKRWHFVGLMFRTPGLGVLCERFGGPMLGPILWAFDVLPRHVRQELAAHFDLVQRHALRRMYQSTCVDVGQKLIPHLAPLQQAALVVWGGKDRFVPLHQADPQAAFPHAQVTVLPHSGHYPHLDDPDAVASIVVPFLRSTTAARPH